MTAAAGAQGAVMKPPLRPTSGATMPSAAAPMIPAKAPAPARPGETAVKMTTPKAIAEGKATSIAARPPHTSPILPEATVVFSAVGLVLMDWRNHNAGADGTPDRQNKRQVREERVRLRVRVRNCE